MQLATVTTTDDQLTVTVRVTNPTAETIQLTRQDAALALGFIPEPTGPTVRPEMLDLTLPPDTGFDVTLTFPYAGESHARLTLLARVWGLQLRA